MLVAFSIGHTFIYYLVNLSIIRFICAFEENSNIPPTIAMAVISLTPGVLFNNRYAKSDNRNSTPIIVVIYDL